MLYGIGVHISFPATIFSPSYIEENKIKPKITLKIEETDGGKTPKAIAASILKGVLPVHLLEHCDLLHLLFVLGVERGNFHITCDILGDIFRASDRKSVV